MVFHRLSRLAGEAKGRLQAEPCRHACHACGPGNMNATWLGVDGSRPIRGPKGRPVRPSIPDLVAAMTMPIRYACWLGKSRKRRRPEPGTWNLPAASKLCNRSFPNPVARVCKPLLWPGLRIAWNQGPKGR